MTGRGLLHAHPGLLVALKRVSDAALAAVAGLATYRVLYADTAPAFQIREAVLLVLVGLLFFLEQLGAYRATRATRLSAEIEALGIGWVMSVVTLWCYLWLRSEADGLTLRWLTTWLLSGLAGAVALRVATRVLLRSLRRRGYNQRTVVIAVAGDLGVTVGERLRARPELGFRVVGYFDDRTAPRVQPPGVPLLGTLAEMAEFVAREQLDEVWIAQPFRAESRIREILHCLRHSTADVRLVPDVFQFLMLNHSIEELAGIPVVTLTSSPMQGANRFLKELEDRVLAALILLAISPLLVTLALAVKLSSPGPVLFKQRRRGWNEETIEVWKFRTMRPHYQEPGTYTLATRDDPRVTRLGAFLRRTSLDELPQFINVMQGRMSIVGPRPYPPEINEAFKDTVDRYMLRHKVKPGITGWAQVHGLRGALDTPDKMELRVKYDLYYIEHWSLWFDLRIILLTLFNGFMHSNAY